MTQSAPEPEDGCTCRNNRTLTLEEAVLVIPPDGRGVAFAKDCPLHGIRDLPDVKHSGNAPLLALDNVV